LRGAPRLTRPRGAALLATWSAVLAAIVTLADPSPATLVNPRSAAHAGLLALYLLTSLWWAPRLRIAALVGAHVAVTTAFLALHPLTALGRDGTFAVTALHLVLVLCLVTTARVEAKLLAGALVLGLAVAETALARLDRPAPKDPGLLDYGELMGAYGEGGFLLPNLHARVVGPAGPVEFVTESHGFRNRDEVPRARPAGRRRVLLVGDSFVAGYRTDQERTVGRALERALRERPEGAALDVVVAGVGHPGAALEWLVHHGFGFEPDVVVLGVTLGNDISQSWLGRRRLPSDTLAGLFMPPAAYRSGLGLFPARADRTLSRWRTYKRARSLWAVPVIGSWYGDTTASVHQMDPAHSLGHFFTGATLPAVETSFADLRADLRDLQAAAAARSVPLLVALLPQRFQTSDVEWEATLAAYGLDPAAFDPGRPNRRIADGCAADGVACFDLLPGFRESAPAGLYQPGGDMHWSDAGHERAGRLLAAEIARRYLAVSD
jgi:hypothetical protein